MSKIAIIGTSGLFPGSATLEEFWDNLMQGRDLTGLATEEDFGANPEIFYQPGKGVVDKCYSLRGGYIRDFRFDPYGYELPAGFLARQDKLYQWPLHVAREALREAGYFNNKEKLRRCGLVLGKLLGVRDPERTEQSARIAPNALQTDAAKFERELEHV